MADGVPAYEVADFFGEIFGVVAGAFETIGVMKMTCRLPWRAMFSGFSM